MSTELLLAALSVGVVHTLAGPDHYLPLIGVARAENWSPARMLRRTAAFGALHCLSGYLTVVLAATVLAAAGTLDALRDRVAALVLLGAGLALALGLWRGRGRYAWPAALALAIGPCEWMLPTGLATWSSGGAFECALVCAAFGAATVATMLAAVAAGAFGLARFVPCDARWARALPAACLLVSGLWIVGA